MVEAMRYTRCHAQAPRAQLHVGVTLTTFQGRTGWSRGISPRPMRPGFFGVTPGAVRLMHKRGELPLAEQTLGG